MVIQVNHLDGQKEEEKLSKEEWQTAKRLREIRRQRRALKKALMENDEGERNWIISVTADALAPRIITGKPVNWKRLVLQTFECYKMPMSTELMCQKLWLHYPEVPFNRRLVVTSVSAALSNLWSVDGKLYRTRQKMNNGYVYGLKHFYDFELTLKPYYWQQYRREEGESEDTIIRAVEGTTKERQIAVDA